jgi:hypothetical protein
LTGFQASTNVQSREVLLNNRSFWKGVHEFFTQQARLLRNLKVLAMHELAPGVVVLEDSWGDSNIIFNHKRWKYANPRPEPGKRACTCPDPREINGSLAVFLGREASPLARKREEVFAHAKSHLSPVEGTSLKWHGRELRVPLRLGKRQIWGSRDP